MTVKIEVRFFDKVFEEKFSTDADTPEYALADEAYRVAIVFASCQAYAMYGRKVSAHEFAQLLEHLDYDYEKVDQ